MFPILRQIKYKSVFNRKESYEIVIELCKKAKEPELSVLEYYKVAIKIVIDINLKEMLNSKGNNLRSRNEICMYKEMLLDLMKIRNKRYKKEDYIGYSLSEDLRRSKMEVYQLITNFKL